MILSIFTIWGFKLKIKRLKQPQKNCVAKALYKF
jgi:hypothetical protein